MIDKDRIRRHSRGLLRVAMMALVVVSAVTVPVGDTSPVGEARAASGPEFCETFDYEAADSGLPDNWGNWSTYSASTLEVTETSGNGGTQAFHGVESSGSNNIHIVPSEQPFSSNTSDEITATYRVENLSGDSEESLAKFILDEGSNRVITVELQEDGLYYTDSSFTSNKVTGEVGAGEWVTVTASDMDPANNTFTLSWETPSTSGSSSGLDMYGDMTNGYDKSKFTINGEAFVDDVGISCNTVSGTVTDPSGSTTSAANIEVMDSNGSVAKTGVESGGTYSVIVPNGNYTVKATSSEYDSKSQTFDNLTSDKTVDFRFGFKMQFTLDDRTNATLFSGEDPRLIVERPDGRLTTTSFNHNEIAYVWMADSKSYNLTVVSDYPALWDFYGFIAVSDIREAPLVMDSELWDETSSLGTPTDGETTPTLDERLDVRFQELESSISGDGTAVTVSSPEPVERVEYVVRDENGTAVYNGTREFDEPTRYWQGQLSDNVTNNASDLENPTLDYSGTFANGTAFNGTSELTFSDSFGGIGGPTVTGGGGGTASTIAGVGLLACGAVLAYRRFGSGNIGQTVSNLVGRGR
ncbi:carboxypeptidase-like regulatory domain-containing protein [Haloarcula sp. JP-L23]|uniref:carboxypeptidase-like regulatory domain-containing protein n=1 Tax=Haloarcula sp. JP-L23 TaxID=2716717 RepID=UPI00140F197F|nr:carboxypeptidase regulatory-like domain-containing protein [Haloarcula sp. JP-L23]